MGIDDPRERGSDVGGDSDAFPALGSEFIERFLARVDSHEREFDAFFVLLDQVQRKEKPSDSITPCWDTLLAQCRDFRHAIDQRCGPPERSPFSAFVHFCFHEINNLITPLLVTAGEGEKLGKQFSNTFLPNRVYVRNYFKLLKQGQPPLERMNLKNALDGMATEHRINLHVSDSYAPDTQVRLALPALSAVLDNLQRGANQVNGRNATIYLVLDSGVDEEGGEPWVYLHFLSDVHSTSLTPERFSRLLTRRPEKGQQGGLGLHLSECLLQAQRRHTNFFDRRLPEGTPRTPACLQFRQAESSAPLTDRDQAMIQNLRLPTNFLFTIDLTGMRVRSAEEQFDEAFDEVVEEIWPQVDDELLPLLIECARGDLFCLFSMGKDLSDVLKGVPEEDENLHLDFSRLVTGLRQRLSEVAA